MKSEARDKQRKTAVFDVAEHKVICCLDRGRKWKFR